jgi:hypothetical protein
MTTNLNDENKSGAQEKPNKSPINNLEPSVFWVTKKQAVPAGKIYFWLFMGILLSILTSIVFGHGEHLNRLIKDWSMLYALLIISTSLIIGKLKGVPFGMPIYNSENTPLLAKFSVKSLAFVMGHALSFGTIVFIKSF